MEQYEGPKYEWSARENMKRNREFLGSVVITTSLWSLNYGFFSSPVTAS